MTTEIPPTEPRLLPWSSVDGKPCYVIGERGRYVTNLADHTERLQLWLGTQVLESSRTTLRGSDVPDATELLFLAHRLAESLDDVLRVADSRGRRLAAQ